MKYKVRIQSVWTDAFSSLQKDSLSPHIKGNNEVVWENLSGAMDDIQFHTNIPYCKSRNFVERKVKEVKSLLSQCHLSSGTGMLTLSGEEWTTICLLIETNLNNTPYNCNSLMIPESMLNTLAIA